jgi:hypothetical protein
VSRSPSPVRQLDIQRAIKAAKASGLEVTRVEVAADGRIIIWSKGEAGDERKTEEQENPWDSVKLTKREKWSRK